MKTKFIIVDGPDGAGKSTLISTLCDDKSAVEIKFKKTLPSGTLLRINAEKDFELLFSMFDLLDKSKTYVLDRFLVSNLVYDKVLRGEDTEVSKFYYEELKNRFNVLEIFLTRPHIQEDFEDDRIKMSRTQFNLMIDEYKRYGLNYPILNRSIDDQPLGPNKYYNTVLKQCNRFIAS
jgi:GTPase SAR1 family protein